VNTQGGYPNWKAVEQAIKQAAVSVHRADPGRKVEDLIRQAHLADDADPGSGDGGPGPDEHVAGRFQRFREAGPVRARGTRPPSIDDFNARKPVSISHRSW
jgi:hypothetical protein